MEHSQIRVLYYPKRDLPLDTYSQWETTPVDLSNYIDFNTKESVDKTIDGSNLPFMKKTYYEGTATYTSGTQTYTFSGTNFITNKFKWHTLIDSLNNRYVILSNTATTITLASKSYFNFYGIPQSGKVKIELPDFEEDDILVIYGWKVVNGTYSEPTNFYDKIIFTGQVVSRSISNDNRGTQLILKLSNMTELMLKTTSRWDLSTSSYTNTIDKIKAILDLVNGRNKNTIQVSWSYSSNPTVKTDGNDFLEEDYYKDDSSAYDAIFELGEQQHTGDVVEYYCYLMPVSYNSFELIWKPKTISSTDDFIEGTDFDFLNWNNSKTDAIATMVFRCGRDCNNDNITTIIFGSFSKGSRTYRYAEDLGGAIITAERTKNPASFNFEVDKYPISYNYTTATSVTDEEVLTLSGTTAGGFITHSGTYTITSDSNYNKFIRYLAMAKAKIKGKAIIDKNNSVRDIIKVRFYNTPASEIPGNTKKFTIYTLGWTGGAVGQKDYRKNLRLIEKTISSSNKGIYLECTYILDEKEVLI